MFIISPQLLPIVKNLIYKPILVFFKAYHFTLRYLSYDLHTHTISISLNVLFYEYHFQSISSPLPNNTHSTIFPSPFHLDHIPTNPPTLILDLPTQAFSPSPRPSPLLHRSTVTKSHLPTYMIIVVLSHHIHLNQTSSRYSLPYSPLSLF